MLRVDVFNIHSKRRVNARSVAGFAKRVLNKAGIKHARLSLVFVGSRYIRRINKEYLNHDFITDVISFALEDKPRLEGEIYVNLDRASTQSRAFHVDYDNEVARLVIHGTLHLVGYDDVTERKRRIMKREEDRQICYWFK